MLGYSWFFEKPSLGIEITDDKMLVFVTMLYVLLTYKISKSNLEIYRYQKIPSLSIEGNVPPKQNTDPKKFTEYIVKNNSKYSAFSISIVIEILYPIPKKNISTFLQLVKRTLTIRFFTEYLLLKPAYVSYWKIDELEPEKKVLVYLDEKTFTEILPVIAYNPRKKYENVVFKKETEFSVIIKCEYYSEDGVQIEKPLYKLFYFVGDGNGIVERGSGTKPRLIE